MPTNIYVLRTYILVGTDHKQISVFFQYISLLAQKKP